MRNHYENGWSMIELMMALAILSTVSVAFWKFMVPNIKYFQRVHGRNLAQMDGRKVMDISRRLLSKAKSSTVQISTPGGGAPPNSRIQFITVENSSVTITWSTLPPNSIHVIQQPACANASVDSIVITNASGLSFALDSRDPTMVTVGLRIDMPLDSTNGASNVFSLQEPNQDIRMVGNR